MKKATAAEIAAKYGQNMPRPCAGCGLAPEVREVMMALRNEHHLSFRKITRALLGEFGVAISEGAVTNHIQSHEGVQ